MRDSDVLPRAASALGESTGTFNHCLDIPEALPHLLSTAHWLLSVDDRRLASDVNSSPVYGIKFLWIFFPESLFMKTGLYLILFSLYLQLIFIFLIGKISNIDTTHLYPPPRLQNFQNFVILSSLFCGVVFS